MVAPTLSVTFAEGTRPDEATHIRVLEFDGPLALLLALIEQRQLDVLTVPLGALAGAYLEALASLRGPRLAHLSAFVSIAAQLIVIKSRALLPRSSEAAVPGAVEEGPDPEAELRRRLLLYRAYRDAGGWLVERGDEGRLFRREPAPALAAGLANARPADAPPLDPGALRDALLRLATLAEPPAAEPEVLRRAVTLAERAEAIRSALLGAPVVVLQDLLGELRDRTLVAVTFLALLELVKRREIVVEQDEPWGPIRCRTVPKAARGSAGLASEPIDETLEDFA
jgi:segregation and condensation protein A